MKIYKIKNMFKPAMGVNQYCIYIIDDVRKRKMKIFTWKTHNSLSDKNVRRHFRFINNFRPNSSMYEKMKKKLNFFARSFLCHVKTFKSGSF